VIGTSTGARRCTLKTVSHKATALPPDIVARRDHQSRLWRLKYRESGSSLLSSEVLGESCHFSFEPTRALSTTPTTSMSGA
jgi:hypothetical protein